MRIIAPSTTNVDSLCDWAEMRALISIRQDCTKGDIQQFIRIDDYADETKSLEEDRLKDSEQDERQAIDVIEHARQRAKLLGELYPFKVSDRGLQANNIRNRRRQLRMTYGAYLYHLFLSTIDSDHLVLADRHFFEVECSSILSSTYNVEAFHFGWTKHNASLGKVSRRIDKLCGTTSIQWKRKEAIDVSYINQNDVGVDIILWQKQIDSRENTLVLIGQCASGHNWDTKLASNSDEILSDLLLERPSAPVVRVFCLPFMVPAWKWRRVTVDSQSVVFDRVRLVAASRNGELFIARNLSWVRRSLDRLTATGNTN